MKIVIDSNVYLSAFLFDSKFLQTIIWHIRRNNLAIQSQQIIQEVLDVITRSKEKSKWEKVNKEYHNMSQWGCFYYFKNLDINKSSDLRDPKDNHIIHLAKLAEADFVLTGDKDLLESKYENIISPSQYFVKFIETQ